MRYGLEDCDVFWNDGPSGDCTGVLEFYAPEFFSGLNSFTLAGQAFKVTLTSRPRSSQTGMVVLGTNTKKKVF